MFLDNAMERINRLILQGGRNGMTELQFYAAEIREWKNSLKRMDQIKGADYYEGRHDILNRKRTIIGADGKLQEVDNLPNNRLIDNQYALMVDQKTNYLVGKPFTVNCQNKAYADALNNVFNKRFHRLLKYVCEDALNGGLGWLFPFYDKKGNLAFKHFPAYEVLPFWADDDHTILDSAIRLYPQEVWDGYTKKIIERVELFKTDGLYRYIYDGSELKPDVEAGEHESYFTIEEEGKEPTELNWERIPLIPFKYNKQDMPRDRWLECRDHGPKGDIEYTVGGSDVSTIFGVNPWVTPLELWMQKKGRMKRSDPKNQNQLDMGHMMEPIAAHFYGIVTGNKVVPDTNMYQHADFPYALADFDYRFEDTDSGEPGIL